MSLEDRLREGFQRVGQEVGHRVTKGEIVVNVKDYGAKGDGVTDDSAAFSSALASGDEVLVPTGTYLVGSTVMVPTGKHLRGTWSSIYTSAPTWGSRIKRAVASSTDPVIDLGVNSKVTELSVIGGSQVSAQHNGIRCGGRNVIRDVTIASCLNGIDGNYKGVIRIDNCQIHGNVNAGIIAIVDSMVSQCYLNVNGSHGINLQAGANDNIILNCKMEWNSGHGINLYQNKHNIITDCNIDRNGRAGVAAVAVDRMIISSNILRRNGKNSAAAPADDVQFLLQTCTNSTVIGNVTETGGNDDGTGYVSPLNVIRLQGGSDLQIVGNDLTGSTGVAIHTVIPSTRLSLLSNNGHQGNLSIGSDSISDATSVGRSVLRSTDALSGRAALAAVGKGDLVVNVKDHGVKGDGTTDDTVALQSVFSAHQNIYFPTGSYRLTASVSVGRANTTVSFAPGVVILSGGANFLVSNGKSGFRVEGNGVSVDMTASATSERAFYVTAPAGDRSTDISICGVVIKGNPVVPTANRAAVDIHNSNRVTIEDVTVLEYGSGNSPGVEVYGLGFASCNTVKARGVTLSNGFIGIDTSLCTDVQVTEFSVNTMKDNGVYILSGSNRHKIANGEITNCEEGLVVRSPHTVVQGVSIIGCSNKGATLRMAEYAKLIGCHFEGNATAIGDDDSAASSRVEVTDCTFKDNGPSNVILLNRAPYLTISGCDFDDSVCTGDMIRLNNRSDAPTINPRITGNRFKSLGKVSSNLIRLAGGVSRGEVLNNTFVEAATAVSLFTSGPSSPTDSVIANNRHIDVTTEQVMSGGVSASVFRLGGSTWTEVTGKPSYYPPTEHSHAISEVTNLQSSLNSKADVWNGAITGGHLFMSPESGKAVQIPYFMNDIAYNNLRGGATRLYSDGELSSTNLDICFEPTAAARSLPSDRTEYVIEIDLWKRFTYGTKVGYAAMESWRARYIKIEAWDQGTEEWKVCLEDDNSPGGDIIVPVPNQTGSGITKLRYTFRQFNGSSFRIGQLLLLNYASDMGASYFLPKGGGEVYGTIQSPKAVSGTDLIRKDQVDQLLEAKVGAADLASPRQAHANLGTSGAPALSGAVDGTNTAFTVPDAKYSPGTLAVFLNGILQVPGEAVTSTDPAAGTFAFVTAPASGDQIYVTYQVAGTSLATDGTLLASGKGYVRHGSNASAARPAGYASVEWVGSVEPTNSVVGDTWVRMP